MPVSGENQNGLQRLDLNFVLSELKRRRRKKKCPSWTLMRRIRPGGLVIQHPSMDTSSNVLRTTSILHSCANCQLKESSRQRPRSAMSRKTPGELPTYVGQSGKPDSLLDLAFSSDSSMVASVDTLQPVSDHLPILLKTNAFGRPGADKQYAEQNEERRAFVMPTWRLCIALFYPWTGRRFLTWRRTLMDCGKIGNRHSFDVWNRLFRSGSPY